MSRRGLIFSILLLNLLIPEIFSQGSEFRVMVYDKNTGTEVQVPATNLQYIRNVSYKDKYGWLGSKSLQEHSGSDLFLLEIDLRELPPGKWNSLMKGSLQLAVELPDGISGFQADTLNGQLHLVSSYLSEGEFERNNKLAGQFSLEEKKEGQVILNGTLLITPPAPLADFSIEFTGFSLQALSYEEYLARDKEKQERIQEKEQAYLKKMQEVAGVEKEFYASLFNYTLYPGNALKAIPSDEKLFNFTPDRGYIIRDAELSAGPSENLMDLLTGFIYYPVEGNRFVINIHHFFEGDTTRKGDEVNYSLIMALPDLQVRDYTFGDGGDADARLAYWPHKSDGYLIESRSVTGDLSVNSVKSDEVSGSFYLIFHMSDRKPMILKGNYQLPLVGKEAFIPLIMEIRRTLGK